MATRIYLVGTLPPVIVKSSAAAAELVFGNALSLELQQADEQSVTTQARLVRAATQAQAIRHVVRSIYTAVVASQDQIVDLMTTGVKVEDAGEEE